ncbi:MAG: hypothetical protein KDA93_10170 [Planctomycetaceae bacterium]|nr:hypothetical protein [Planctomycetaceae bacterium]
MSHEFPIDKQLRSQLNKRPPMPTPEIRKQISIFVPISDWKAIRQEAARKRIPMTELCRQWMHPSLTKLREQMQNRAA